VKLNFLNYIAVDGEWGQWSVISQCDRVCGFGQQRRTRVCNDPAPRHGGRDCIGTPIEIIHGCNPYPCPGKWCLFIHVFFLDFTDRSLPQFYWKEVSKKKKIETRRTN